MARLNKRQAWAFGHKAETWAVWMLRLKGYRILARRYKSRLGEIDIIAQRGSLISFIEVKGRRSAPLETPVTNGQMQRIARTAQLFMQECSDVQNFDMCFDIILVRPWHWPDHQKDAWRP